MLENLQNYVIYEHVTNSEVFDNLQNSSTFENTEDSLEFDQLNPVEFDSLENSVVIWESGYFGDNLGSSKFCDVQESA